MRWKLLRRKVICYSLDLPDADDRHVLAAAMPGVSANAIQVTSHRIRRKLSLSDHASLEEKIRTV